MDSPARFKELINRIYGDCYLSWISVPERRIRVEGPLRTVIDIAVTGEVVESSVSVLGRPGRHLLPCIIVASLSATLLGCWMMRAGYAYSGAVVMTTGLLNLMFFIRLGGRTLMLWESLRLNAPNFFGQVNSPRKSAKTPL